MNIERAILISFLGNYLINNIVGAIVATLPFATGNQPVQYTAYFILAAIGVAIFTWWYFKMVKGADVMSGGIFGLVGFVVAILTAILAGAAGVIAQSGSIAQLATVLPNFGTLLLNWSTLIIFGYWLVPAAIVGFLLTSKSAKSSGGAMPRPMI